MNAVMTGTTDRFLTLRLLFLFPMLRCAICLITNQKAGAVFTTETPVTIASALQSTWVSVPLPVLIAFNLTSLDFAFQEFEYEFAVRWRRHHGRIGKNIFTTEVLMNTTYLALEGLEYEMLEIDIVFTKMRERSATYLNGTEAGLSGLTEAIRQTAARWDICCYCTCASPNSWFLSLLLFRRVVWWCRLE